MKHIFIFLIFSSAFKKSVTNIFVRNKNTFTTKRKKGVFFYTGSRKALNRINQRNKTMHVLHV